MDLHIKRIIPGAIKTQMTSVYNFPLWFMPLANNYVKSALKDIIKNDKTSGYFVHNFFTNILKALLKVSPPTGEGDLEEALTY